MGWKIAEDEITQFLSVKSVYVKRTGQGWLHR